MANSFTSIVFSPTATGHEPGQDMALIFQRIQAGFGEKSPDFLCAHKSKREKRVRETIIRESFGSQAPVTCFSGSLCFQGAKFLKPNPKSDTSVCVLLCSQSTNPDDSGISGKWRAFCHRKWPRLKKSQTSGEISTHLDVVITITTDHDDAISFI